MIVIDNFTVRLNRPNGGLVIICANARNVPRGVELTEDALYSTEAYVENDSHEEIVILSRPLAIMAQTDIRRVLGIGVSVRNEITAMLDRLDRADKIRPIDVQVAINRIRELIK